MKFLKNFTKTKLLVTHNGSFHADDVFACACLQILLDGKKKNYKVVRTRDENIIAKGDYVFDVGGTYDPLKRHFDHHQKGGAGARENGIEYSSFGLVWKEYGEELTGSKAVVKRVDEHLVQTIDAEDNGISIYVPKIEGTTVYSIHEAMNAFHPSYRKVNGDSLDNSFVEICSFAKKLLKNEIIRAKDQEEVSMYINESIGRDLIHPQILVLDEYVPREEIWIEMVRHPEFLFVIAPGTPMKKMWRILGLRKDLTSFNLRKNLPEEWSGCRDEDFEKTSGISGAVFCHRKLFMAVAKSKEGAIELAKLAVEK